VDVLVTNPCSGYASDLDFLLTGFLLSLPSSGLVHLQLSPSSGLFHLYNAFVCSLEVSWPSLVAIDLELVLSVPYLEHVLKVS